LVLVARLRELLEQLNLELTEKYGTECKVVSADLASPTGVDLVIEQTQNLDVGLWVAAAGFGTSGAFTEIKLQDELAVIDVNCRAVVQLAHHFASRFRVRGRGGLVLMSSIVAFQGAPRAATYAATKAFIQSFAEGLRVELMPHNVDVLAVAPGPIRSGFEQRANMKMDRAQTPDLVAKSALAALDKRTTTRPGWLSKFLGYSLSTAPRWGRVMIMTAIMGGMTKHQKAN
jgi:short-subunit dehydrogenase